MFSSLKKQIHQIWRYRELLVQLFWTFVKLRHVGSVLGFFWTLLNPFLYIITYWLVFSIFIRMGIPNYPLFLIPGFLAWNFFSASLNNSSEAIINSKDLISKIAFPKEILVLTNIAVPLFDFIISLVIYFIVINLIPGAYNFSPIIIMLPLVVFLQVLVTLGFALIIACASVYFRDIPQLVHVGTTLLFFLTPVFYPISFIPGKWHYIFQLNPMAVILTFYHDILYYNDLPSLRSVSLILTAGFLFAAFSMLVFGKYKKVFAEIS
ncbi:MAG TPA: ABC transporter permease [Ignavibacteriaceae bacterium]|nr:ABC transporter permease [Ignavibacteriaceae bacterium]